MSGTRFDTSKKGSEPSIDKVIGEIQKLVGLEKIKEDLNKLIAFGELIKLRRERDIPMEKIGLHMIFKGPPGTGKTVLARKFGELFKSIGLIRDSRVVEIDRSMIVGQHLGDAEKLMRDAFERARNGVLFIDEAYALAGISADVTKDQSDTYGKGATNTLLKLMEDHRSSVVVIAAGNTDEMDRFLKVNVGLKSRFARTYVFKSYNYRELLEIFESFATDWNYVVERDAVLEAEKFIKTWDVSAKDFGNARDVRTFAEAMLPVQAERIAEIPGFKSLSNQQLMTITASDVEGAVAAYGSQV